jgi:predicted GIY-YIG superfamily endonuclease
MIGYGQPGNTYDRATILATAPSSSGVYALYDANRFIYIGEGQDIQARLLAHFNGDNACITRSQPTGFVFELSPANQRVARQDALIAQLGTMAPAGCNQRFG